MRCHICNRELDNPSDPLSADCGGDCIYCMIKEEVDIGDLMTAEGLWLLLSWRPYNMPVFVTRKYELSKTMADSLRQLASYLDDGLVEIISVEKTSREWLPGEWELKLVYKDIDPTK